MWNLDGLDVHLYTFMVKETMQSVSSDIQGFRHNVHAKRVFCSFVWQYFMSQGNNLT